MMPFSLLYASRSLVPPMQADAEVQALVTAARARNAAMGVTGCLIFAGGRFAQILEGKRDATEAIMHSVLRDKRHTDVTVLEEGIVPERRFSTWALGYAGPSVYVQRMIARPVTEALRGSRRGILDLITIMTAFDRIGPQCDAPVAAKGDNVTSYSAFSSH